MEWEVFFTFYFYLNSLRWNKWINDLHTCSHLILKDLSIIIFFIPFKFKFLLRILQRDSWEPAGTEAVEGLCGDALAPVPLSASSSLAPETTSPTQFRSSSRGSSSQSYSLHSLDEINYHSSFPSTSGSFAPASFMTEPASKLAADDADSAPPALTNSLAWAKEDTASAWSQYEVRRAFWYRTITK